MASGLGRRQGSPIRPHTQRAGGRGTAAPRTHPPGVNHGSWAGPVSGGPRHREILGGAMTQMANTIHDRLVRRFCPQEPCKLTASSPRPCLLGANPTDLDCLAIADGRDSGVLTAQEFTMRLLGQPGQPSLGLSPTTTTDKESIDKDWRCRVGRGPQHRRRTDSRTKTQQRSRQPTPTRAPQFSGVWGSTPAFQHLPSAPCLIRAYPPALRSMQAMRSAFERTIATAVWQGSSGSGERTDAQLTVPIARTEMRK